jgi:hypothetical protein
MGIADLGGDLVPDNRLVDPSRLEEDGDSGAYGSDISRFDAVPQPGQCLVGTARVLEESSGAT